MTRRPSEPSVALTLKQRRAAEMLVLGVPLNDVAAAMKTTRQTVTVWAKSEAFRDEVERLRRERLGTSISAAEEVTRLSIERLREAIEHGDDAQSYRASVEWLRLASPNLLAGTIFPNAAPQRVEVDVTTARERLTERLSDLRMRVVPEVVTITDGSTAA